MQWRTVVDAKRSFFPFDTGRTTRTASRSSASSPWATAWSAANGDWWTYHKQSRRWTRHWLAPLEDDGWDGPQRVEKTASFSPRELAQRPALMQMLLEGLMLAHAKAAR